MTTWGSRRSWKCGRGGDQGAKIKGRQKCEILLPPTPLVASTSLVVHDDPHLPPHTPLFTHLVVIDDHELVRGEVPQPFPQLVDVQASADNAISPVLLCVWGGGRKLQELL